MRSVVLAICFTLLSVGDERSGEKFLFLPSRAVKLKGLSGKRGIGPSMLDYAALKAGRVRR